MEDADLIKMKPAVREKRVAKKSFIPLTRPDFCLQF